MIEGMNVPNCQKAMEEIQAKKQLLSGQVSQKFEQINSDLTRIFGGSQVEAMKSYSNQIQAALDTLYSVLDGGESTFAQTLGAAAESYAQSNENVRASYAGANVDINE